MTEPGAAPSGPQDVVFDVRSVYNLLRRRRWMILVAGILGASIAYAQALVTTPVYLSSAELEIEPPNSSAFANLTGRSDLFSEQELETQVRVLASEQVAERVIENLSLTASPRGLLAQLGVTPIGDTRVLSVAVADVDAERAAELSEGFVVAYLEWRREDAVARLLQGSAALRSHQGSLTERLAQLDAQIESAVGEELQSLLDERDGVRRSLASIETQLALYSDEDAFVRGGGQILRHAAVPGAPIEPRPTRSAILGLLFGLGAGIVIALVRDRLDDSVHSDAVVAAATGGRPVLSHIPWHEEAEEGRLVTLVAPAAPASEAFRALRTNVRFSAGDRPYRSILVTSPIEAEGKTTVAVNYAITAARAGYSTVLVDADMRQPRLDSLLSLDRSRGLSRLITRQQTFGETPQGTSIPGLEVITAGPTPPNPAELLGSQRMADLLSELEALFDLVVVDAPPVLPVADALEVATITDATLLVIHAVESKRRPVAAATERLDRVGAKLAGTVLTAVDPRRDGDYYQYGGYYPYGGYGAAAPDPGMRESVVPAQSDEAPLWARDSRRG